MATYSPYSLPKYMFLDLPRDVNCSVARFRLRVHTLRCETVTWNPRRFASYSQRQDAGRVCLFAPEQQQTPFFLTLIAFYEQASSRAY